MKGGWRESRCRFGDRILYWISDQRGLNGMTLEEVRERIQREEDDRLKEAGCTAGAMQIGDSANQDTRM